MNDEKSAGVQDRRNDTRQEADVQLSLDVSNQTLTGRCENRSGAGVLLFSENNVRVQVTLTEDGKQVQRSGRIVRVERMSESSLGYAVEFDD